MLDLLADLSEAFDLDPDLIKNLLVWSVQMEMAPHIRASSFFRPRGVGQYTR